MSRKKRQRKRRGPAQGAGSPTGERSAGGLRGLRLAAILVAGAALALAAGSGFWRPRAGAADGHAVATAVEPARGFDGERAFQLLKDQVAFGPRVPGTVPHTACRDFLLEALKKHADQATLQKFTARLDGRQLPMANVIARWKPQAKGGVLLAAHWDTRPSADRETDPGKRNQPIPGANDGASGVAVLLELARRFKESPPPVPAWIVLFDGEDYGPELDRMFLGSRHFAERLPPDVPPVGVLLDMVGDRNLRIPQEGYSRTRAADVVREVYAAAARAGYAREFPAVAGDFIQDDHLPLLEKGVRIIDLIDFDYPAWHTLADTPEQCSDRSLQAVGDVLGEWVYSRK